MLVEMIGDNKEHIGEMNVYFSEINRFILYLDDSVPNLSIHSSLRSFSDSST